jgi:DNA-binding transcriptional LysR family regulator
MQGLDWNDLRYVLALAHNGTLAGAARFLKVDPTTVARRLRAAERALGTRLFERLPDGVLLPTEAGRAAFTHAELAESSICTLMTTVGGQDMALAGHVRLTSVPILIGRVLIPAVVMLTSRHPQLRIDLISEPRNLDLTRREADIALRLARPSTEAGHAVLARRIGQLDYGVYAPSSCPSGKERTLPWVCYEDGMGGLPQARWTAVAAEKEGGRSPVALSDAEAVLSAIRAGLGRAPLPRIVGDAEPGLRLIARPEGLLDVPPREVWCLTHPDMRSLARVAAVIDWLSSLFNQLE